LKKYDAVKMKKNLDDNKRRLAEKTSAAEVPQKSLGKTKAENAGLLKKVAELEPGLRKKFRKKQRLHRPPPRNHNFIGTLGYLESGNSGALGHSLREPSSRRLGRPLAEWRGTFAVATSKVPFDWAFCPL